MNTSHDRYTSGPGGRWSPGEGLNSKQRETMREFQKRVSLLNANRLNREFFTTPEVLMGPEKYVRLAEFAKWIVTVGRDPVSPELLDLVSANSNTNEDEEDHSVKDASWQDELPREARERKLDKYPYQWVLWKEALRLLDEEPELKLAALADDLCPIASRLGFSNRSGNPLDPATIKRYVLPRIRQAHQAKK